MHHWVGRIAVALAVANVWLGLHVAQEFIKFYWRVLMHPDKPCAAHSHPPLRQVIRFAAWLKRSKPAVCSSAYSQAARHNSTWEAGIDMRQISKSTGHVEEGA